MFKRILLCYDGSLVGRKALRRGAELAISLQADVHLLAIVPDHALTPAVLAGAAGHACLVEDPALVLQQTLDEAILKLKARGVAANGHITSGNTVEQITIYTRRFAIDLIVLGHYPQPSGGFWWTGSQRISLAESAACCVLVAVDDSK